MDNDNTYNNDENKTPVEASLPVSSPETSAGPSEAEKQQIAQDGTSRNGLDEQQQYHYDQYNSQIPPNQQNNYVQPEPNGMSTASLVLGILSLVLCCCCYVSIPLGALGIIFALLSKGSAPRMHSRSKTGLGLSIGGLCLTILLTIGMFVSRISYIGSDGFRQQLDDYMEYYQGDDYDSDQMDEFFRHYLGDDYGSGSHKSYSHPRSDDL